LGALPLEELGVLLLVERTRPESLQKNHKSLPLFVDSGSLARLIGRIEAKGEFACNIY
jgi:hypothetical protein